MSNKYFFCPLQEVDSALKRKWSLLIIYTIGNHKEIGYSSMQKELKNISPKTLSDTLAVLEKEQLIKKFLLGNPTQKTKYQLTKDGLSLYPIILNLLLWSISRKKSNIKQCKCHHRPRKIP